ncbi:MAG: zinc-ribbon domain-containing protein [Candidatus Azotimanducaceae bacterium]|nr:hypothetical protein [Gammaproteobacteria bacterium]
MFLLFGEVVRINRRLEGMRACDSCGRSKQFFHVTEVNYFSFFAIPLFPISKVADYFLCGGCDTSYASEGQQLPSHIASVKNVITYILVGYGMAGEVGRMDQIASAIIGESFSVEEIKNISYLISKEDIFELLGRAASTMNPKAKSGVIEAAFLSTYLCCEMQYEDRLRINLMGNVLGLPLPFVEAAIENVRSNNYYGVQRLIVTI